MATEFSPQAFSRVAAELRLDRYCGLTPRFVSVVDADAVLSSLDNQCRTGWPSRILRIMQSDTAFLYAPDHVYWEIYEKLPKIARSRRASAEQLRGLFESEYLPWLRFVTISPGGVEHPVVKQVTDPLDRPTAQLATLVAPCVVLSQDRSLRRPGIAADDWRQAAAAGAQLAEASSKQQGMTVLVGAPAYGALAGARALARRLQIPTWAMGALLVCLSTAALWNPERRRRVGGVLEQIMETFAAEMEKAYALEASGQQALKKVVFDLSEELSLEQKVAIVLARSREPQLAREVCETIEDHFGAAPTVASVRAVLESHTEFAGPLQYRWTLGRPVGCLSDQSAEQRERIEQSWKRWSR